MADNILMVSADRAVVAGDKGPFYYTLEAFSKHWDRIDVIGTRPEHVAQTMVFGNVHLHHPTGGKLRQAAFIAATGRSLASQRPYTVITSHDYNPFYNALGAWRIARTTGIPWVSEIHHVPGFPVAATARERLDLLASKPFVRWAARRAAGFRVVNAVELPALLQRWGVPSERIHVLPSLYLDLDVFRPDAGSPLTCDLLMVGRLVPNKGVMQVLQALRKLVARGLPDLKLRLIGKGPELPRLRAFIQRAGLQRNVEHVEWVADAPELAAAYRSARVLIVASTSEGGPRVAAESMACGTPVAGTRVGLLPELIDHGRNGLLYDGTTASLTLLLQRLLTDGEQERTLRGNLPGDLSRFERQAVIAGLAAGLKAVAAGAARR